MILKTIMFDLWIFIHKIKRCFFYGKQEKRQKRLPKNSEKNLVLRVSIDQEFLLIARMFFSIDRKGIENRLIQAETLWWNSSLSQSIENSFRSIECYFRSIKQESRIDRTRQWLCDEFLHFSINWEFLSIDRMFLFDWSKRNQVPIDLGRNFVMKFFIISIDREFLSIDRMFLFNWSERDWESIEQGSGFVMNFFIFSIDREKGLTDQRHWILNFHLLFD